MQQRHVYAAGIALSLLVATWIFAAPMFGLPAGITGSTRGSMGDEGITINVWVDTEPSVGDVVIFEAGDAHPTGDFAAHRVIAETDAGYVTQGDANRLPDQNIIGVPHATDETTVGVVVARVPARDMAGVVLPIALGTVGGSTTRRVASKERIRSRLSRRN